MTIRIICKKIPKYIKHFNNQNYVLSKFNDYNNHLTKTVKDFNGFINSESYYNSDICEINNKNIDSILTLSEWKSFRDWNNWYYSSERNEIYNMYCEIIKNENIYVIKRENTFLL